MTDSCGTDFTGWPADATAFLAEIAEDNTREFWDAHRHRHESAVQAPNRALAAAMEAEFGPVRVLRPYRNRRFRPDAPPYRTDTGAVARTGGGAALGVVLGATALTVSAGHRMFDGGQLRRFRAAVDAELALLVAAPGAGLTLDPGRPLTRTPRGHRGDDPRIGLLRMRGLQLTRSWPVDEWLATPEPLHRVRAAWRAAAPVLGWLDRHVGPADVVPARSRPGAPEASADGPTTG